MKKVRRAFALLLSAALLLGVLEPAAIAAGPVTGANLQTTIQTPRSIEPQSGTCGDNATWSISAEGVLTISGTGAIGDYTENDAPWQSLRADITAIVIEKGITRIGNYAFHDCWVATSAVLPEGLVEIGENAFRSCGALEEIDLPPELTTIGIGAFYYTSALTSITIPGSVETFLDAFNDSGLETVTIENGVDEVDSYAFCNCYHLKSVTLPDSIQSIGNYAFSGCQQLEELDLPDGITSFGEYAFANTAISEFEFPEGASINAGVLQNTSITSIVIPQGVTTIGQNAFYGCENLATVTFPSTLTRIEGGAFSYTALTSLHLPDGVEFIGHSAFRECNVLETVTMTDSVTTMDDNAFDHCDILRSVTLSDQIETIGLQTFSQCKKLETIHLPASLKTIGNDAFQYCESLRSLTLPDGTESIGSLAFRGCSVLEAVVIPASVTSIDSGWNNNSVFAYCGVLTLYVTPDSHAETYAKERGITYEYLAEGKTVRLDVVDEDGKPLDEEDYSIRWYENGERLNASGGSIGVDAETQALTYEVALGEELAFQYQTPGAQTVELTDTVTTLECQLQPLPQVTVIGAVTDAEGKLLPGASVTISQSAGIYEKTQQENLPVESDGSFSIQLPVLETTVTAEMDGYYTRSRTITPSAAVADLGNIALPTIPEARVELSFTVESAVAADETPVTTKLQTGNGITVSAYNVTTEKELTNAVFQYPYLVLGDNNAKSGDEVRITATDTWGKMTAEPVTVKLTDDPSTAAITFTENGAVSALLSGDFPKRAAVFDGDGNLVQTATVEGQLFTSQPLPAGSYQVAFLEKTSQISAIPTLGYLTTLGLIQGEDYVLRSITVENGKIATLGTVTVPQLEMSYLVVENTSVSVNKAAVPAGQYVTVRAAYELDEKVSSTGQTLVVDLPEGCELVDGSVTVDGVSANYSSSDDGTVSIPTNKEKATVLFYVTAQGSGEFSVTCSLEFTPAGTDEKVTQPLGSGFFSATAMQLHVLDKTSKETVRVSGKAAPNGTVEIYDGSRLAAETTANAAGTWFAEVGLQPRYQFEVHDLQAKVTAGGTETLSDVARVTYDANYIDLASITMINTAHPPTNLNPMEYVTEMVAADYQGKSFYYRWDPNHPVFTFTVKFDENDTERLSGVTVVAANAQGEETLLPCQYQASAGAWTTSGTFDTVESLPVSLSVRYNCDGVPSVFGGGKEAVESMMTAIVEDTQEYQEAVEQVMEQESAKLSLGNVTAGGGGAFSMSLLYGEEQIGTYAAEEVDYTQFDLDAWREQGTVIEYTLEDGSCYFTRRELSGGEGTVTISQWTAYPADTVLTKETITLSEPTSPVLRLSQGERLAASRSAQTLSSPRLAADWSDLFEITNTIAQCLPGWAGSLASGINTISDVNILRMGVDSNMSIFELDYNNVLELLDEKCDDGTPRVSSKQRTIFLEQLDELNDTVLEYPGMVFTAYAMSYFADYVVGKTIGDLVPEEISDLADSENINTIYSSLEGFQRLMMKLGKKDGVKLSGRGVDMVVGVTTGLVEFDTNVVTSMVSDATKNVLQLNLDAQEYMDRRFQEIHGDFQDLMKQIQLSYGECKDDEEEDGKEDGGNGDGGDGRNGANSLSFDMTAGLDPSGYVCEAVPSNVLEGVTVTLYKMGDGGKEEEWDAANYDQTNPVTTNADGVYAWDVPKGKWKVKFEKKGYQTAETDWLTVPPPQTDVNVSLVSEASPEIASVSAYPEGVRVEFSQYMDIGSVMEKLSVSSAGQSIAGTVKAENAEASLEDPDVQYASVFFFTFTNGPESGEVTVSATDAKNYAENTVQETVESKTATIEAEPTGIAVRETASVGCDGIVTLELQVQPSEAGAHKTIQVASSTSHLFNVPTSVETDENGKATLTLSGKLPGAGQLTFSLDGTSLTAATQVAVGDTTEVLSACAEVTANPVPGSVAPGKEVTLQTETAGAVIYYTLNKTCPCDLDNEARKEYTGPIEITEDTYIIAYAVKEGYEDSKTSHFSYTVKEENPPVVEPGPGGSTPSRKPTVTVSGTGGTAVAQSSGVVVITPATGYKIAKVLVNGQEVAIPADGNLTGLQPSDKVTVTFEKISESVDLPFTDLAEDAWYSGAVEYVYAHGLMRGMSETAFAPNTSLTRAQAVQILYNLEGQPVVSGAATFTDAEHWAKTPIAWAQQTGVVDGYEDNSFRPENPISRQEFAQMMYNYAKYKGYDLAAKGNLDAFPDADKMGAWAEPSLAWANGNKLINGHDDGTLDPGGITIRAQAASILMRFDLNIVK